MRETITVYSYWTWDSMHGLGTIADDKRTREEIERIRGIIISGTAEVSAVPLVGNAALQAENDEP